METIDIGIYRGVIFRNSYDDKGSRCVACAQLALWSLQV